MTKLAPEWVRTSDPVIRSPERYRWTTAPASDSRGKGLDKFLKQQLLPHDTVIENVCRPGAHLEMMVF